MATIVALVLVAVIVIGLRRGGTPQAAWRPQLDWRERDPRS
jgi:hypothetical protein